MRSWTASATSTMPKGPKREGKQETGNQSCSTWGHNRKGKKRVNIVTSGSFRGHLESIDGGGFANNCLFCPDYGVLIESQTPTVQGSLSRYGVPIDGRCHDGCLDAHESWGEMPRDADNRSCATAPPRTCSSTYGPIETLHHKLITDESFEGMSVPV